MSRKPRCRVCRHRPGPRQVTATRKRSSGHLMESRIHKKPCDCVCHRDQVIR